MVKVNGAETAHDGLTVEELLRKMDYDPQKVAVELNEEIVPKAQYPAAVLQAGDTVEVVSFVGGG